MDLQAVWEDGAEVRRRGEDFFEKGLGLLLLVCLFLILADVVAQRFG